MRRLTLYVSRPGQALRSNGSHGHWYATNAAGDAAEGEGFAVTREALGLRTFDPLIRDEVVYLEYREELGYNAKSMDDDNLIGTMKSTRDGIARGLGYASDINLRVWGRKPPTRVKARGSRVRVRVWIAPEREEPEW